MATSQNGWPVVAQSAVTDRAVLGTEFPNGWLKGDVDTVFTYLIGRLHAEVEPIHKGGCWGWYVKPIEGTATISNHASGTAIDYNAPRHPMGVRNTYAAADRVKIRKILADLAGVVRWGGDYTGRPDDMHFEIHANRSQVSQVADWIRGQQEADVALSPDDKKWIAADNDRAARAAAPLVWKVTWSGEAAETRLANASIALRQVDMVAASVLQRVDQLGAYVNQLAADEAARDQADAARDAALPQQFIEALGLGNTPEQVAAFLRQLDGVDWPAVGRALAA